MKIEIVRQNENPKGPTNHRGRTFVKAYNNFTSNWEIYIVFPNATDAAYYVRKLQSYSKPEAAVYSEILVGSENGMYSEYQYNIWEPYGDPCWKKTKSEYNYRVKQQFHPIPGVTNA